MNNPYLNKFGRIKECCSNILKFAAEHLFLTFLVLVFISLLISSAVFYKYYIVPQNTEPEISQGVIKFQESDYEKMIGGWRDREKRFESAKTKEYFDPFKP